jgi:apolipoprotein D and lipocalin family protein
MKSITPDRRSLKQRFSMAALMLFAGCVGIPENVQPVGGFELGKYLGTWYEIARLDHSFERGLEQVTAVYSMRDDGGVRVINRGFNPVKNVWKESEGKAFFIGAPDVGRLKVSFFGPFYGGYNIIALDKEHYSYSMVCGPDVSYLWILSRTPRMDAAVFDALVAKARALGFETDKLLRVKQG